VVVDALEKRGTDLLSAVAISMKGLTKRFDKKGPGPRRMPLLTQRLDKT
jgi:hypothetical protein